MLKIKFEAETDNDFMTPLTISNSIINLEFLEIEQIQEISEHLKSYVKNFKAYNKRLGRSDER